MTETKRLRRSTTDRTIAGVLAGIAEYYELDPTMVRAGFLLAVLLSGGTGVLAYPVLWMVIPEAGPEVGTGPDAGSPPTDAPLPPKPVSPAPPAGITYGA